MAQINNVVRFCDFGCGNVPTQNRQICDACRLLVAQGMIPPCAAQSVQRRLAAHGLAAADGEEPADGPC